MVASGDPRLAFDILGPEIGLPDQKNRRYRGFFVVDRLKLDGFDPTTTGAWHSAVVRRQDLHWSLADLRTQPHQRPYDSPDQAQLIWLFERGREGVMAGAVRIGTRSSPLARWQAEWVAGQLQRRHPDRDVALVEIKTQGDRDQNSPLATDGGIGIFTKEIQYELLAGTIDVAVHSLKDLPTQCPTGLALAVVPPREEAGDALVAPISRTLGSLPKGARVGTGSLRRRAQLLYLRPDLEVVAVRGNVETRLDEALRGRLDAVVLAEAGLRRLGLDRHVTERLAPPIFLPAVAQGALGLECRADDVAIRALLAPLDDPATHRAVRAERRLLAELEGGCMIPLAAWAREAGGELLLDVAVFDLDGRERIAASASGPLEGPDDLGRRVARDLRALGVERLLRPLGRTWAGASRLNQFQSISEGAAPSWIDKQSTPGATVLVVVQPVGWVGEWHENPKPQWILPLSGRWFVETMDVNHSILPNGQIDGVTRVTPLAPVKCCRTFMSWE
jgi:hydroxymethylbilane synthase